MSQRQLTFRSRQDTPRCLHKLVNAGNTLVAVELNMDVIKSDDRIIEIGPEGGPADGHIVAEGQPEQMAKVAASHTG